MVTTLCAYCGKNPPIANSHVLPRWMLRSALDGSVTGKLRSSDNINKRVQDAEKVPLLCRDCETRFSKLEDVAAKGVKAGAIIHGAQYDSDFVSFLVSILWRVAVVRAEEVRQKAPGFTKALLAATETWKHFLDGKVTGLGAYPVWFTILDTAVAEKVRAAMLGPAAGGKGAAPILNRYFANWLGCEVVVYESSRFAVVWAKAGSWLIVGVVSAPDRTDSASVQLATAGGALPNAGHAVPPVILATLGHQSWEYMAAATKVSPNQRQKIMEEYRRNAAKISTSTQNLALQADINMFGNDACVELPP